MMTISRLCPQAILHLHVFISSSQPPFRLLSSLFTLRTEISKLNASRQQLETQHLENQSVKKASFYKVVPEDIRLVHCLRPHLHTFLPSYLLTFLSIYLLTFSPSHHFTFSPFHLLTISPSYHFTFSSSHLLIFSPSHHLHPLLTFSHSHLLTIFTSSPSSPSHPLHRLHLLILTFLPHRRSWTLPMTRTQSSS